MALTATARSPTGVAVDHYVTGAHARAHVEHLRSSGLSIRAISRESGIAPVTIRRVIAGHRVRTSTQEGLLKVLPGRQEVTSATPPAMLVNGTGARRRLRSLIAQGWIAVRLAEHAGCPSTKLRLALSKPESKPTVARFALQVRETYEQLWNQQPPCSSRYEQAQAKRVRREALAKGWAPPGLGRGEHRRPHRPAWSLAGRHRPRIRSPVDAPGRPGRLHPLGSGRHGYRRPSRSHQGRSRGGSKTSPPTRHP